jgi:hypothetical protein
MAQVCAAFADNPSTVEFGVSSLKDERGTKGGPKVDSTGNGSFTVNTPSAEQLSVPAQRLGVSPDRLAAAMRAAVPAAPPAPPAPPSEEQIISRMAQNLGISPDRVRAAIVAVEGPGQFYLVVPFSGPGKP